MRSKKYATTECVYAVQKLAHFNYHHKCYRLVITDLVHFTTWNQQANGKNQHHQS